VANPIDSLINNALLTSPFAESLTYSRPQSPDFAALPAFTLPAIVNTSGEFASPSGPLYAEVFLQISEIPLGPQKGDLITAAGNTIPDGIYLVQEIFSDRSAGCARLKMRFKG
jgi:hypothetical protein